MATKRYELWRDGIVEQILDLLCHKGASVSEAADILSETARYVNEEAFGKLPPRMTIAARLVQADVGGFQNVEHCKEHGLRGADATLEFFVRQLQFFLDAGH